MAETFEEKMNRAAGIAPDVITTPTYEMPYKKGDVIKSGEVARTWTGPKPWAGLRNRSTMGSAPFSDGELKQGYRKVR